MPIEGDYIFVRNTVPNKIEQSNQIKLYKYELHISNKLYTELFIYARKNFIDTGTLVQNINSIGPDLYSLTWGNSTIKHSDSNENKESLSGKTYLRKPKINFFKMVLKNDTLEILSFNMFTAKSNNIFSNWKKNYVYQGSDGKASIESTIVSISRDSIRTFISVDTSNSSYETKLVSDTLIGRTKINNAIREIKWKYKIFNDTLQLMPITFPFKFVKIKSHSEPNHENYK